MKSNKVEKTISYDNMGNAISYQGNSLTWYGKQLKTASVGTKYIQYSYDKNGLRTEKDVDGTYTEYYYNGSLLMGMETGNDKLYFSYDATGNVVSVDYSNNGGTSSTTYYYVRNAQGDIIGLVNSSGTRIATYTYDTWGKMLSISYPTSATATERAAAAANPFRYRGYVYDTETGWYYLQSRYYDPELGRFISSDVYLSTGQGIIGHNAYAYCLNNPVNKVDEDGRWPLPFDKRRQRTDGKSAEYGGGGSSSVSSSQSGTNDTPNCPDVTIPDGFETGSSTQAGITNNVYADFIPPESISKYEGYSRGYAVKKAWDLECEFVKQNGYGLRYPWSEQEIQELIETGRVKGYVGHHMYSVSRYTKLKGNPYNIQFLTIEDHFLAHGGNWRNVTSERFIK